MARKGINIGVVQNDGTGDTLRTAGGKINDNFIQLYAQTVLKSGNAFVTSNYTTNSTFQSALANTNSYIQSNLANTNAWLSASNTNIDDRMQVANTNTLVNDRMQVANVNLLVNDRMQIANVNLIIDNIDVSELVDANNVLKINNMTKIRTDVTPPLLYVDLEKYDSSNTSSNYGVNGYFKTIRTQYSIPSARVPQEYANGDLITNANGFYNVGYTKKYGYLEKNVWNKEALFFKGEVDMWTSSTNGVGNNYIKVHQIFDFDDTCIGGKINLNTLSVEANTAGGGSNTNYSSVNEYFFIKNQSTSDYDITTHFQTGDTESQPVGIKLTTAGTPTHLSVWLKMPYAEGDNTEYDYRGDGDVQGIHTIIGNIEWDTIPTGLSVSSSDGFEP